ncbi:transporter substrate-binding domain-containing protein [Sinirhodobacter populi]|uniref:Transporter substrate-binding domain-containing protein n=1 Tax=Paenirhodobacter populi TaxID=2306993 RepID=A0A443K2H0_9RHOB|nr:transporter substrate-binding domain-containing protein [Sinirhodobacter populi]RWR26945.1 transporter substrate-binding domain-containing protein [Sinirhodobacter populi]
MKSAIAIAGLLLACANAAAMAQDVPAHLRIGTSLTQMPWGFYDETQKPTGVDVALCGAIAQHLGAEAEFISLDFKGLIPALQADRFDMVCAAMYITPEREQAIAMVPYIQASQSIVTKKSATFEGVEGLCGHSVSVLQGSGSLKVLQEASAACEAGGKPAVAIQAFDSQPVAIRALENDSVEAFIATDSLISFYMAKNDSLKKIATGINPTLLGIGFQTGNTALAAKVADALAAMRADGSYDAILKTWGIESAALPR